ncbi:MAG: alpha/beta hydrolase [Proteobacteria bacterium]|nr:MAG: alpha/beta hydrolase [Pseudomonadota bacterium]
MTDSLISRLSPWEYPVNGLVLRGWHTEPTGKPVIHFIHGNGFSALTYSPFLALLAEHYDLFLSNIQAHGGSDSGDYFHGWNENARYCHEAWKNLGKPWQGVRKIAMGHSFGGVLSALITGSSDHDFDELLMLDPVLFSRSMIGVMALTETMGIGSINKLVDKALKRRSRWPCREEVVKSLEGKGMFSGWHPDALQAYADYSTRSEPDGSVSLMCPPEIEARIFGSYPRKLWSSVKNINTPVTVIYGEKTYPFVPRAAIRLKKINKRAKVISCPGGHCFMQEDFHSAAELCLDVLSGR